MKNFLITRSRCFWRKCISPLFFDDEFCYEMYFVIISIRCGSNVNIEKVTYWSFENRNLENLFLISNACLLNQRLILLLITLKISAYLVNANIGGAQAFLCFPQRYSWTTFLIIESSNVYEIHNIPRCKMLQQISITLLFCISHNAKKKKNSQSSI